MRTPFTLCLTAALLVTGACAGRNAVPRPFPGAATRGDAPAPPVADAPVARGDSPRDGSATVAGIEPVASATSALPRMGPLVALALGFRGVPYRNGGSDPAGFDCSGLVQYVFARQGIALPREVRDQFRAGTSVDRERIEPGDLLFFETVSRGPSHVGIAIGGVEFVHAPSSRGVVRVERFTADYWARRWVGARRVIAS